MAQNEKEKKQKESTPRLLVSSRTTILSGLERCLASESGRVPAYSTLRWPILTMWETSVLTKPVCFFPFIFILIFLSIIPNVFIYFGHRRADEFSSNLQCMCVVVCCLFMLEMLGR